MVSETLGTCVTSEMPLHSGKRRLFMETMENNNISSENWVRAFISCLLSREFLNTTLTSWHKHRYYQSMDSSSVLPLLCPEIHTLLLVALPSLSYDLEVKEEGKKPKIFLYLNICSSTDSFAKPLYMYFVQCCASF